MSATVEAPANIAFVKYWGAVDLDRALPTNPSISMTLSRCVSRSTVSLKRQGEGDEVLLVDAAGHAAEAPPAFAERVVGHLNNLRQATGHAGPFQVATRNSFPSAAGMASSASGFAALTLAVLRCLGREVSPEELSTLARRSGSGSAARSVMGGYVEWPVAWSPGEPEEEAYATAIAPAEHWDLRDVIAVVESGPKKVSSLDGHRRAPSSPHFARRQELLAGRLEIIRQAIHDRDLAALGPVLEEEAIELHLIAMSSRPPIYYWTPATVEVLAAVRDLRDSGVGAWSTMDAGANVHVLCEPADEGRVAETLRVLPGVRSVIRDGVGPGPTFDVPPVL